MPTYTNYLLNPSFEVDTDLDGLADNWDVAKTITGTEVYSRVAGRNGGYAQRVQYTGVAGDAAGKYLVFSADTPHASFAPGDGAAASFWIKGTSAGCTVNLYMSYYDSSHAHIGDYAGDAIIDSASFVRYDYNWADLPVGTDYLQLRLQITAVHEGDTFDFTIDDAAVVDYVTLIPYFDGGQTFWHYADCGWSGTANASISTCGPQSISGIPWMDGTWTRAGAVFATHTGDEQESSVMKDGATWKLWYTEGGVSYATASSPYGPWTKYGSNPVLATSSGFIVSGATVMKVGSLYHMFVGVHSTPITHDHLTSLDGITWTLSAANIMDLGAAGEFDDESISRQFVWVDDDGHWYMIYEAHGSIFPGYTAGIATAIDPDGPWTKWTQNPVFGGSDMNASPTVVRKLGDRYYAWLHGNCEIAGVPVSLPTDVGRAYGTTPYLWTADPTSVLVRQTADEGVALDIGQCADTCVVQDGDDLYMFYTATIDGTGPGPYLIKMAFATAAPYSALAAATATIGDCAMFSGDTAPLSLTLPCDLTGCTASFGFATTPGGTALTTTAALVVDASAGTISVPMAAGDTSALGGVYYYEVQVTDGGGFIKTLLYGRLLIRPDTV